MGNRFAVRKTWQSPAAQRFTCGGDMGNQKRVLGEAGKVLTFDEFRHTVDRMVMALTDKHPDDDGAVTEEQWQNYYAEYLRNLKQPDAGDNQHGE